MIGDLFDSPWKILIIAVVIIVLFGSKTLPSAARSLGQSMRILEKEVQGLYEEVPHRRPEHRSGSPAAAPRARPHRTARLPRRGEPPPSDPNASPSGHAGSGR